MPKNETLARGGTARQTPPRESDVKAGWKVSLDNSVECRHCDHVHPPLAETPGLDA